MSIKPLKFLDSMSLRSKSIMATTLPLAIVVCMVLVIYAYLDVQHGKRALAVNSEAIVQAMVEDFEKLYALDEQGIAIELSKKLACFENIEFLLVHAQNGDVVYGYHRPGVEFQVLPRVTELTVDFKASGMLMRKPVKDSARETGLDYITVRVSLRELNSATQRAIQMAIVAALASILLGLTFAFAMEGFISRPMIKLERTALSVLRSGDYSKRASIHSNDEVGRMASAFNAMLDKIQSNQTLIEAKVGERTAELHTSERRFRQFLESAPDAILIVDSEGKIVLSNERVNQLFGFSADETKNLLAARLLGTFWSDARCDFAAQDAISCCAPIVCEYHDRMGLRKDGSMFSADFTVSHLASDGERLMAFAVRDITERKIMESQLAQSQKLESIGQLAAGIAHEINTPIQFIGDNARFLKDSFGDLAPCLNAFHEMLNAAEAGPLTPEMLGEARQALTKTDWDFLSAEIPVAIDQSLDGVGRVAQIVRAMKDFSHPSQDEMQFVDLNRAIESTLTVCRNEWKYVADVVTEFDEDLPHVPCHAGEFNQVILNIVINAAHAIEDAIKAEVGERGKITIKTIREADCVQIRISDTGTGIPEEMRVRIFDPFFTTKEVGKGTGQGLAIAHSVIVNKHGGKINLESRIGHGTTFIIDIPLNCAVAASS